MKKILAIIGLVAFSAVAINTYAGSEGKECKKGEKAACCAKGSADGKACCAGKEHDGKACTKDAKASSNEGKADAGQGVGNGKAEPAKATK